MRSCRDYLFIEEALLYAPNFILFLAILAIQNDITLKIMKVVC